MFKLGQARYVTNQKGISLMRLGRYKYIYEDLTKGTERVLVLGTDIRTNKTTPIWFYPKTRWLYPYDDEVITKEKREEIKANIREALLVFDPNSTPEFIEDMIEES